MKKLFIVSAVMLFISVNLLVISGNLVSSLFNDILYWNGLLFFIVGLILFIYTGTKLLSDRKDNRAD